jgi:hypothetical protein
MYSLIIISSNVNIELDNVKFITLKVMLTLIKRNGQIKHIYNWR